MGGPREDLRRTLAPLLSSVCGVMPNEIAREGASAMAEVDIDERKAELRAAFIAARGYWSPLWDGVLDLDPGYFEAYLRFSEIPWKRGGLSPKVKEFIYIAIDVATTHLFVPGIRIHVQNALKYGASVAEILAVIELTSSMGLRSAELGMEILHEELEAAGIASVPSSVVDDSERQRLKAEFIERHHYWSEGWQRILMADPEFFGTVVNLFAAPFALAVLDRGTMELIQVAIYASVTHLEPVAMRRHIRASIELGVTEQEIAEVLQLASVLGIHSSTISVPILLEEAESS